MLLLLTAAVVRPATAVARRDVVPFLLLGAAFLAVAAVATAANLDRVALGPTLLFLYGFLGPLAVFAAVVRIWPPGNARAVTNTLVALTVLQLLVVAGIDAPKFAAENNPDVFSGTFGENAYQLVFFLLVSAGVLVGVYTFERGTRVARLAPALLVGIAGTIVVAQYRVLLMATLLTVLGLTVLLGARRGRGALVGVLTAGAMSAALILGAQYLPVLKLGPTYQSFTNDPSLYFRERLRAADSVSRLYADKPEATVVGTGPGTFSSRAWYTFAEPKSRSKSNVAGRYVRVLTQGKDYHTDVADKYVLPQIRRGRSVVSSKALSSPLSSYFSILAEVGIAGLVIMVIIYLQALVGATRRALAAVRAAARPRDPLPAPMIGGAVAFFLLIQMAVFENWLEVTRISFLAWILLAIGLREYAARYPSGSA
ncbi:MAG: hypothetical protein H0V29_09045 [Thermoleophilaceae bacterium]|nr:hypothetical protein [Thermoleophilaceae bacterium]